MKFPPLLLLAIPLASAHTLQDRQVAPPTPDEVGDALSQADPSRPADCLTLCSMAAFADSSTNPRCAADDGKCQCNDEGWVTSLTTCVNRVCAQNVVGEIFDALKVACKRMGAPLTSEPSYGSGQTGYETAATVTGADGSLSTVTSTIMVPGAEESVIALSSAISAASSVIIHTTVAGAPSFAPSRSAAPTEAEAVKTTSTAAASATSAAPSASAAPTSGAGMLRVGGLGMVVAFVGAMYVL